MGDRAEVRDRGSHDQGIKPVVRDPQERVAQVRGRLDPDDRGTRRGRHLQVRGHERDPGAAIQRCGGDRDAHLARGAIPDESDRVDRLASPAGTHDDMSAGEVGVAGRAGQRWTTRRLRSAHRPTPDSLDHGVHDRRQVGEPAHPRLAGRKLTQHWGHDGVAEAVPEPGHVGLGRGVDPHVAVHRRRHDDGSGGGQHRGRDHVAGEPVGHGPQPMRRGRRDHDRVRAVGDDDVPDAFVRQQFQDIDLDRVSRQGGER